MTTVPMTRSRAGAALSSVAKASDKFRLSRRRMLARGVGLGGLLLLPRRAWAAEHEHGTSSSLGLVPDKIVQAMGGHGEYVTEPAQIRPALERAVGSGTVACVNVMLDPDAPVKAGAMGYAV